MALRAERVSATREQILTAAERLFAEQGVFAVSNRRISEAAGQGNNTAVGYHFGAKADLVRAIVHKHAERMDLIRRRMLAETAGSADVRDWVACLVRPFTEHLAAMGNPTWFARFGAQVMTDPALREIMIEEALASPTLIRVVDGLNRCLPGLPGEVRAERGEMTSQLMMHGCAERERALAEGRPTPRASWHDAATGLIDAITGLWTAPVTHVEGKRRGTP
ncbi:TetR/AcrR family transcriptional regulator [Microtetraspora niveoalba]|uniref:TetR/AcrR family transcriptional regulator n=1 Tax=Microtetraspora niveoalba TaxID=46175 RepID=UPI000832431D|nr:TetR family transcriptional regulator [Microtetraspora niveoalba]